MPPAAPDALDHAFGDKLGRDMRHPGRRLPGAVRQ
jgi:hypothetical protein